MKSIDSLTDLRVALMARCWCATRSRVPSDPKSVTTVRPDTEVPPRSVGVDPESIALIWRAVERLYASGLHPAMQLCLRHKGQVLIDRAIGHSHGNGPNDGPDVPKTLVTPDTPITIFSASKAITAMMVHWLDERNLIRLDDHVAEYIPEFGIHGKERITIRHVLTHRAGIPTIPSASFNLDLLEDPDEILALLCDARPMWRPGRWLAYHTITGGFIMAELVKRVCGEDIRTLLDIIVREPLGMRWMNYGVPPEDVSAVAINYPTGMPVPPPFSTIIRRALSTGIREVIELSNDPRFLQGIIPSANIVATANEVSLFYQVLLSGGEVDGVRVFDRRTIRRATVEQSYLEFDLTLGLPLRYGMGFILGGRWLSLYGPATEHAFGHLGFTNIFTWADPERQVAAALLTTGKPVIYPQIVDLLDVVRQITNACSSS